MCYPQEAHVLDFYSSCLLTTLPAKRFHASTLAQHPHEGGTTRTHPPTLPKSVQAQALGTYGAAVRPVQRPQRVAPAAAWTALRGIFSRVPIPLTSPSFLRHHCYAWEPARS